MRIKNGFSAPTKGAVPSAKEMELANLRERLSRLAIRPAVYAPGVNFEVEARVFVRAAADGELQADVVTSARLSTFHRQAKSLPIKSVCLILRASGADDAAALLEETAAKLANELTAVLEGMSDEDIRPLLRKRGQKDDGPDGPEATTN
jgi:hypothetical protein